MKAHHHLSKLMGCSFVITAVHEDSNVAWQAIRSAESEIRRIEKLISSWSDHSETARINQNAGKKSVPVSQELFELIERSISISELTCGAFDISGTVARYYWKFNNQNNEWLSLAKIKELQTLINYKNIEIDRTNYKVFLRNIGMIIGFGGIGKGYAANRASLVMKQMGVSNGLINASGDLLCWGSPPNKTYWPVKIPSPHNRSQNLLDVRLDKGSVVTSGAYENYTIINNKRYSHIINPRTATPVSHTINTTVICPDAELADGLATAISVLPIEESLNLLNRLQGIECIIIDANQDVHFSNSLNKKAYA